MGNYTPTESHDEAPLLAKQRRSLDQMSAQLTHNLNLMIAEQEARVKSFAAQHPGTRVPQQWPQHPALYGKTAKQKEANVHSPVNTAPAHSVPPPPTQQYRPAPQAEPPRQQHRQQPPPVPPQVGARPKLKQHDNTSIGTVPMIMIVLVIIMMLRACS